MQLRMNTSRIPTLTTVLALLIPVVMATEEFLTCHRPEAAAGRRRGGRWLKMQEEIVRGVPCEMGGGSQWWCGLPGEGYPWSSVRRFVSENTGLMRRMYGEVRQLGLMRMEFGDTNRIDDWDGGGGEFGGERSLEEVGVDVVMTTGASGETQTQHEEQTTTVMDFDDDPTTTTPTAPELPPLPPANAVFPPDVEKRTSNTPPPPPPLRAVNACPTREEVVAPYWANNTRGEVLALLNLYPFEQYVHFEKCNFEHKQMYCRDGCRCEQQYRLHRLLAFDPTNECRGIFSDWFKFPSCCVCKCWLSEEEIATHLSSAAAAGESVRSPRKLTEPEPDFDYDQPDVRGVDPHFYYRENLLNYPRK